jgi:hypothetical protein
LPAPTTAAVSRLPNIVLWAWQRPEDLSSIDPTKFGVAYLACHVRLTGDTVEYHWRDQKLSVPPKACLVPVLRIDTDAKCLPSFNEAQLEQVSRVVKNIAALPQTVQVQIDFDALVSERKFYRQLLNRLSSMTPLQIPISITALASWCLFDDWIKDLPVSEMVPMMFSLGQERNNILFYFRSGEDFRVPTCCQSLGLSLEDKEINQLMIPLMQRRNIRVRVYVFTKTAWTKEKIDAISALLGKR